MADLTQYLQKKLLDHFLNIAGYVAPNPSYISLHTGDPTEVGSHASEVSDIGSDYARQSLGGIMAAAGATDGISRNTALIQTLAATTDWGTITHLGIEDALTAGNMTMFAEATEARTITIGEVFRLSPSQLAVQFD